MPRPSVHFSSETVEWYTPPEVFEPLHEEFKFTLDVCAADLRCAKLIHYFSPSDNGLLQTWAPQRCWMNPPYAREIKHWVKKAAESGTLVVGLLPARTDTAWWHDWVMGRAEVRFMRGRVKFMKPNGTRASSAPFPTAIVVWRPPERR